MNKKNAQRGLRVVFISAILMSMIILCQKLKTSGLVQGGSQYVLKSDTALNSYIKKLPEYKGKNNLTIQVGLKFVSPANNYDQDVLRDYYNLRTGKNYSCGMCWASAVLSAYRFKNPGLQTPYIYDGYEIISDGVDRYKLNPFGISEGILHSSAQKILNDMYNNHQIAFKCVSTDSGYSSDIYSHIQSNTAKGTIALFKIPKHEMTACGYCTVRVQWKENKKTVTKFEDMILVNDTWYTQINMGVTLTKQKYSYYPARLLEDGWNGPMSWDYALSTVQSKQK